MAQEISRLTAATPARRARRALDGGTTAREAARMERSNPNLAQRTVLVVALAGAGWVVGHYAMTLGTGPPNGWYGYAPLAGTVHVPGFIGLAPWARLVIWLALIVVWALVAYRLLRSGPRLQPGDAGQTALPEGEDTPLPDGEE